MNAQKRYENLNKARKEITGLRQEVKRLFEQRETWRDKSAQNEERWLKSERELYDLKNLKGAAAYWQRRYDELLVKVQELASRCVCPASAPEQSPQTQPEQTETFVPTLYRVRGLKPGQSSD
jgi:hypothetical protein